MQEILELERRIAAAFDRIDRGLEQADRARAAAAAPPSADKVQTNATLQSLEAAEANNADWEKRYTALAAQLADKTLSMANEIALLTAKLDTADLAVALATQAAHQPAQELQSLRDQLFELHRQIDAQSLELTQLRAQRAIEIEELKSIVAALTPLIEEALPHA